MRHLPILAVVLSTTLAVACGPEESEPEPAADQPAMEAEVPAAGTEVPAFSEEVRTEFAAPEGSASDVRGTLRLLVPVEGLEEADLRLRAELAGLEAGPHAWHIHAGPCGVDAPVEIALSPSADQPGLTDPLIAAGNGTAEAEVDVPPLNERWVEAGAYSVRIHESAGADPGAEVACATL